MKDYASLQEIDQKRIMEEKNKKEIDATRPTQRELMLATKFEEKMSFRPLRDTRDRRHYLREWLSSKWMNGLRRNLRKFRRWKSKNLDNFNSS